MSERTYTASSGYRFGFGGQEKDNEVYNNANTYTAEFWEYDSRYGRRWNRDPINSKSLSPYQAFDNSPIVNTDELGDRIKYGTSDASREEKRRIRKEVRNRMKRDPEFKKQVKAWRRDRKNIYYMRDDKASGTDNGKEVEITGATVDEAVLITGQSSKDNTYYYVWNRNQVKLPDQIEFNGGEATVSDDEYNRKYKELIDLNNIRPRSMPFANTVIPNQVASWMAVYKNKTVTFEIYSASEDDVFTDSGDGKMMSNKKVAEERKKAIAKALKKVQYVDMKRVKFKIINSNDIKPVKIRHD